MNKKRAQKHDSRPTRKEAESAMRLLLRWCGEDVERSALKDTPSRLVTLCEELFRGYREEYLQEYRHLYSSEASPNQNSGVEEGIRNLICMKDISFHSYCEHHLLPFFGKMHLAYYPHQRIASLSHFVRIIETFSQRLQSQERLTQNIMDAFEAILQPKGFMLLIEAQHLCLSLRGVRHKGAQFLTLQARGILAPNTAEYISVLDLLKCGDK